MNRVACCAIAILAVFLLPGRAPAQGPGARPPLKLATIVALVEDKDLTDEERAWIIKAECVSFRLDDVAAEVLTRWGASATVLETIRSACYQATTPVQGAFLPSPAGSPTRLAELMDRGEAALKAGDVRGAAAMFEEVARANGYRDVLHNLVTSYARLGQSAPILVHGEKLVRDDPLNRDLRLILANAYIQEAEAATDAGRKRTLQDRAQIHLRFYSDMKVKVTVAPWRPEVGDGRLRATLTNLRDAATGQLTFVVEYVDPVTGIVTTHRMPVPSIGAQGTTSVVSEIRPRGAHSYSYRLEPSR